jgi:enoyl-CoA hydratase/carnithine racemase
VSGLLGIDVDGAVALVSLQRPEKRNALSIELRLELADAFAGLAGDDAVSCAVLTGAGSAFCSGMDTTQFGGDRRHRERLVAVSVASFNALGRFPKPAVAAVNGPAIAGGFALALLCDIRVASEMASFGFAELPRGIPPAYAAARSALPAALARELALTGRVLDAREALERGVVSALHDSEALMPAALELARRIADAPRVATLHTKRRILIDREITCGSLFREEERLLTESLLGGDPGRD